MLLDDFCKYLKKTIDGYVKELSSKQSAMKKKKEDDKNWCQCEQQKEILGWRNEKESSRVTTSNGTRK